MNNPATAPTSRSILTQRVPLLIVLLFCIGIFLFRLYSASYNPITWDEPVYFNAAKAYVTWIKLLFSDWFHGKFSEPFTEQTINQYWQRHLPSPPLAKTINGLTWAALHSYVGDLAALRSGSALCYAALFGVVIWHARAISGWIAAVVAALALLINPRLFCHAGTANLDTIGMVFSFFSLFYFWKTAEKYGWKYLLIGGVLWGMAFSAKNSALLVLPVMFLWALLWVRKLSFLGRLIAMQAVAAIVFFLLWPWLYHDTLKHLDEFAQFAGLKDTWQRYTGHLFSSASTADANRKLTREFGSYVTGIAIDGKRQFPWHYSLDVLATVTPAPTLVLFALGTAFLLYNIRKPDYSFVLLGMWIPVAMTSLPSSPIYDMERFLLICFPFIALTAGVGAALLARYIKQRWGIVAVLLLMAVAYVPSIREWRYLHPLEFSYYNEFIGGLPGAVRRGFPATYWLQGYWGAIPFINQNVNDGSRISAEEERVLQTYQQFGILKKSVVPSRMMEKVKVAEKIQFFLHQRPMDKKREELMDDVFTVELHDVPIVTLYRITPRYINYVRKKERKRLMKRSMSNVEE